LELSTIIGLAGGVLAVIFTVIIEGGSFISFLNAGALILILGGSVATGILSFGIKEFVLMPKYFLSTIFPKSIDFADLVVTFVSYSEKARREGLLSLEDDLKDIDDDVTRLGIQLVIDGTDPEIVRNILDNLSNSMEEDEKVPCSFFETIGGFSPTLGIIGTVMGLVHVLENLGTGTGIEALGKGIAVAFIATFYGIGFANLVWLPLSNKTKFLNKKYAERREIIKNGVLAIQNGDNPRIVKEKLICLISDPSLRRKIYSISEETEKT
jgi:chemotaxis protein MotA